MERIFSMTRAAICTGWHPVVWMQASGVAIRIPGKHDYTKLNAYRSISQLRWMGNVVKQYMLSCCLRRLKEVAY
jgi:hypothetical protein